MATGGESKTIETHHDDMIHDIQFDYYSKRVASCSSDRTIKIFDVQVGGDGNLNYHNCATLTGHEGPVWQVAWAHPKFTPQLLASCSYDGSIIIYQELSKNTWTRMYQHHIAEGSVNSICWAPPSEAMDSPTLAYATSQGGFGIIHFDRTKSNWNADFVQQISQLGCNAISWAPAGAPDAAANAAQGGGGGASTYQLVTGSCDNKVRIWSLTKGENGQWSCPSNKPLIDLEDHEQWVRDVAWAPNTAMPFNIIASCSDDKRVHIYQQKSDGKWSVDKTIDLGVPVWRVSWSVTGNILAVSASNHEVKLYKQAIDGKWVEVAKP